VDNKSLVCESIHDKQQFDVEYDKLVMAMGVKTNTFKIPSIKVNRRDSVLSCLFRYYLNVLSYFVSPRMSALL
jgi:hypothetical protein